LLVKKASCKSDLRKNLCSRQKIEKKKITGGKAERVDLIRDYCAFDTVREESRHRNEGEE